MKLTYKKLLGLPWDVACTLPCVLPSLLLLVSPPISGVCVQNPDRRHIYYTACPTNQANLNGIKYSISPVPSATYCGNICLYDQDCASFNLRRDEFGILGWRFILTLESRPTGPQPGNGSVQKDGGWRSPPIQAESSRVAYSFF
ncbi:hypothetical protein RRG08_016591 [Elysia crispata]|uniref:Apple domain-containing protein n=1 Tax=Elysia crispata TaxID=231223 RepID=A0AAE1A162_9GAST|nr:hypothetical protein RRG08_016591 [Elysia crispata]